MGHLRMGAKLTRPALPPLLLWNAVFIYGAVDPCVSWEITSPRAGGSWQGVSKETSLPPQLELLETGVGEGVAAGDALGGEEEVGLQVVLGTAEWSAGLNTLSFPPFRFRALKEGGD